MPAAVVEPETADAEFVSLEDADAEAQGKKNGRRATSAEGEDDPRRCRLHRRDRKKATGDVTDIIGDVGDKEEET